MRAPFGLSTFFDAPDTLGCLPFGITGFLGEGDEKTVNHGSGKSSSSELPVGSFDFELDANPLDRRVARDGPAAAFEALDITLGPEDDEDDDRTVLSAEVVDMGCGRDAEASAAEREDRPEGFFVWDAPDSLGWSSRGSLVSVESLAAPPVDILRFFAPQDDPVSTMSLSSSNVADHPQNGNRMLVER